MIQNPLVSKHLHFTLEVEFQQTYCVVPYFVAVAFAVGAYCHATLCTRCETRPAMLVMSLLINCTKFNYSYRP